MSEPWEVYWANRPTVTAEMLDAFTAPITRMLEAKGSPAPPGFELETWIRERGLTVVRESPWNGGHKWVLERCPWNPEHTDRAAWIVRLASGAIAAGCHHESCAGKDWHALRDALEPDWRARQRRDSAHSAGILYSVPDAEPVWEPPLPFTEFVVPPFLPGLLPPALRRFAEEVAESTQVPVDLPALLSLAVVAGAGARGWEVRVGRSHVEPLNLWVAVVMEPGSRKSAVFRELVQPLEAEEARLRESQGPVIQAARDRRASEEARVKHLREKAVKEERPDERERLLSEAAALSGSLTPVPAYPQLLADDVTPEKLVSLLRDQHGRLALMSSEGGVFGMMAGRYGREGGPNLDVYLKGHAGDTLRVDRVNREPEYVHSPALTLGLTVQPDVIRSLADQPGFRGRGLLGRFLYSLPESRVGTRRYQDRPVDPEARLAYSRVIRTLLARGREEGPEGGPRPLHLTGDALAVWAKGADEVEALQAEGRELAGLRDWGSKLAGAVARIAGCLHLVETVDRDPSAEPIHARTVLYAWEIGRYLWQHALAAYGLMGAHPHVALARRVLGWLERTPRPRFTLRECHKVFPNTAQAEELVPALELLEGRGYLHAEAQPPRSGPGRRPSPAYRVNPLWQPNAVEDTGGMGETLPEAG